MVLVIDTSSALAAAAIIGGPWHVTEGGRQLDVSSLVSKVAPDARAIRKVVVASGPGSFTGLRAGCAYAVGLALGLEVPIFTLPTLTIQAARARTPVTAMSEAGRGRVYFQESGGPVRVGEAPEVPTTYKAVGWLRDETRARLRIEALPEAELRSFADAVTSILDSATLVSYGRLGLEYMTSFSLRETR